VKGIFIEVEVENSGEVLDKLRVFGIVEDIASSFFAICPSAYSCRLDIRRTADTTNRTSSEKLKVVQLVAIFQDVLLDLAAVRPGDEVFHVPRNQEGRVSNLLHADSDMPLLNEFGGSLDGLCHA
jgi:hypothetical protein